MGPRQSDQQKGQSPNEPSAEQNDEEQQATAGAAIPAIVEPEPAVQQLRTVSLQAGSPDCPDSSFDSRSIASSRGSFTSSRKTPIHRRLTKIFGRSHREPRDPLIRRLIPRNYGPRIKPIIRSHGYPQGYGKLAAIEACDPNFLIYRKFAWLHNRLLLHYQDELAQMEKKLNLLDEFQFREEPDRLISRRRDDVYPGPKRKDLLKAIDSKLAEYDSLLFRIQKKSSIKRPTLRNQSSLCHLITNTQSQVSQETEWIYLGPDLAALAHDQEYGKFNTFWEDLMNTISKPLTKAIFRSAEQRTISGTEEIELLSPTRIDAFLRIILTILAAALLLVPVLILFKNQPTSVDEIQAKGKTQILTIFVFTLAFSASCSIFTKAKRQEVFTATAAYCAVLVVFLGNTSNVTSAGVA